jgi:hypothetical protein
MFTIERDMNLLESAIGVNPLQLGKAKWADVCEDLRKKYKSQNGNRRAAVKERNSANRNHRNDRMRRSTY